MGYPPPPRRSSDQKRYYYSNNPNRRHTNPYSKRPYVKPYSSGYSSSQPVDASTSNPVSQPMSSSQTNLVPSLDSSRPSRYDPTASSKSTVASNNFSKHSGSRYNPDANEYLHQPSPLHASNQSLKPNPVQFSETPDHTKSRYSRNTPSRYNPNSSPVNANNNIYNGASTPTHTASAQYLSNRHRPRSMESINVDANYSYSSHVQSPEKSSNSHPNSTTSFFNRNNKWRTGTSYSSINLNNDNYSASQFQSQSQRSNFWDNQNNKYSNSSTNIESLPYSNRYNQDNNGNHIEYNSEDSKYETEKHDSQYQSMKSGALSPGSSLIHSVPQTTREVTDHMLAEHRKFDFSKSRTNTPIEPMVEDETEGELTESTIETVPKGEIKSSNLWTPILDPYKSETKVESLTHETDEFKHLKTSSDIYEVSESESQEPLYVDEVNKDVSLSNNYEYIGDPKLLKTDVSKLRVIEQGGPYKVSFPEQDSCIFPMNKTETRLWELKHMNRKDIIARQRYLLKTPIRTFKEFRFFQNNLMNHKEKRRSTLLKMFNRMKYYQDLHTLSLRSSYIQFQTIWEKDCEKMEKINKNIRKDELEYKKKKEEERKEHDEKENGIQEKQTNSSRRRNRADFVDDTEMENVMLQIDPDYKHIQAAAIIPVMELDPVDKFAIKFQNVNNLVTDKDQWATRLITDGVENFTEHEHELFLEGYLSHPKKFGKISSHMGGLRSPEECVMHYYKTKRSVNYKSLLVQKNKRRKGHAAKNRKKKEKSTEHEELIAENYNKLEVEQVTKALPLEPLIEKALPEANNIPQMEQVVVNMKVDSTPDEVSESHVSEVIEDQPQQQDNLEEQVASETSINKQTKHLDNKSEVNIVTKEETISDDNEGIIIPKKRSYEAINVLAQHVTPGEDMAPNVDTHDVDNSLDTTDDSLQNDNQQRRKNRIVSDHKSSYWSVKEAQAFPALLQQFGSQWSLISEKLSTKSTTMVRNYYQRNAAQFGWKTMVEDLDSKRNVGSSGSVQQTQILIQPEQYNSIGVINGIPSQQKPALGFFSNQSDKRIVSTDSTLAQPFVSHRDSFSNVSTPTSTLPPPRLPSIQLQPNPIQPRQPLVSPTEALKIVPMANESGNNTNVTQKESGTRTSISDLMNAARTDIVLTNGPSTSLPAPHHMNLSIGHFLNNAGTEDTRPLIASPDTSNLNANSLPEIANANANANANIVVQKLPKYFNSESIHPRSSSISSLLNPVSRPRIVSNLSSGNHVQEQERTNLVIEKRQSTMADYNFANDPLAALAAVASAPETLASILPDSNKARTDTGK